MDKPSLGNKKGVPKREPKPKPEYKSFFRDRRSVLRKDLKERLRNAPSRIPGTTRRYTKRERIELEKEFGKNYGAFISRRELGTRLRELRRESFSERNPAKKRKIKDKISFLEKQGGIRR